MAIKRFSDSEIGDVFVQKRRGTKSLRLRIGNDSVIRVSQPVWVPYQAGFEFAKSRKDWLAKHRKPSKGFTSGMPIGIRHTLHIIDAQISSPVRHYRKTISSSESRKNFHIITSLFRQPQSGKPKGARGRRRNARRINSGIKSIYRHRLHRNHLKVSA